MATTVFVKVFRNSAICVFAENLIQMANEDLPRRYKLLTPIECLGKQDSIVDIRVRKANVYEKADEEQEFNRLP